MARDKHKRGGRDHGPHLYLRRVVLIELVQSLAEGIVATLSEAPEPR